MLPPLRSAGLVTVRLESAMLEPTAPSKVVRPVAVAVRPWAPSTVLKKVIAPPFSRAFAVGGTSPAQVWAPVVLMGPPLTAAPLVTGGLRAAGSAPPDP